MLATERCKLPFRQSAAPPKSLSLGPPHQEFLTETFPSTETQTAGCEEMFRFRLQI